MGAWAERNFDSDEALDYVDEVAHGVASAISVPEEAEDIDLVMAAVAVRMTLVEHCHASKPRLSEIEALRDAVLAVYDEKIDGLDPEPGYKEGRRKVIVDTFDHFLAMLSK
ncbi:MAG TPA: hypothetical protein VG722_01205 [Tepidisphaeraceae bacterium]|nr:hypothetical protein [Tepidisphaeraceae bacterium]